ncbi:MAG: gamma-glutamyltransferase [Hyphomicrobium sp.]
MPAAKAERSLIEPEEATIRNENNLKIATDYMISTSSREASEAGLQMLREGGTAIDAAIAAQLVLGLVEPQSSGLGGGAFLLHWDSKKKEIKAFDGRETAPNEAKTDRFLIEGKPMPFLFAMRSGLSVGTPGVVQLMWKSHQTLGKLPWGRLFDPAIRLAKQGFKVSERLHLLLLSVGPEVFNQKGRDYFFDKKGLPRSQGYNLKNPEYASTLENIAGLGVAGFYSGHISEAMIKAVALAPNMKGDLSIEDLYNYKIEIKAPLCTPYRSFKVCSMPPPSSGGIAINQILQILENYELGSSSKEAINAKALHLIVEAEKLAYADRNLYLADPQFIKIPAELIDPKYLGERRKLLDINKSMPAPKAGTPSQKGEAQFGKDATFEATGTSQISTIDKEGNAVSMTTTVEGIFGSGIMTSGFLLNNQMTDFSFYPNDKEGKFVANRVEAGKRPRSSMSPTLVFDSNNKLRFVLGSPGGGRIIFYLIKSLIALIDWKQNAYEAAALLNFGSMGETLELEYSWNAVLTGLKLKTYGHKISIDQMNSGLNILQLRENFIEGASDPRREGSALGE